jgi:integrase
MAKPKPIGWKYKKSKPFSGKEWRVWGYVDGKRKQYWFSTEKAAKADVADRNRERDAYGSKVNLDSESRLEAFRAAELLAPHNRTIMDAVRYYLAHLATVSASVPLSTLAQRIRDEFKRRKEANEVSPRHARTLTETLGKLELRFSDKIVSEITTEELRSWLTGLPLATKTRNKHRGYTSQIFSLAVDYGFAPFNPVSKIKKFNERATEEDAEEGSVLSADETERLFRAADKEVIPFLTLSFFAGIRVDTLKKLDWSEVKFDEKRVIVPRYKGKNQLRYRVTLSDNALEWLKPHVKPSGSILVLANSDRQRGTPSYKATRGRMEKAAEKAKVSLPDNTGRKTFISMHVAHYENVDKTALEADNSPEVIKKDYLDIVTREDAAMYWAISPK